jgi:hypothetical protein
MTNSIVYETLKYTILVLHMPLYSNTVPVRPFDNQN